MKALFIAPYFPPANAIGAVRASNFCEVLLSLGHEVRVVSAEHRELEDSQSVPINRKYVEYVRWFDSNPKYSSGITRYESIKSFLNWLSYFRFLQKLVRSFFYWPDRYQYWIKPAGKVSGKIIESWRPDIIISSAPPFSGVILAKQLSSKYDIPWAADFRDLWAGNEFNNVFFVRKLLDKAWERRVLGDVSLITTVSEDMSKELFKRTNQQPSVILNGFREFRTQSRGKAIGAELNIVYTGSLYSGLRDLRPFLFAIKEANAANNDRKIRFKYFGPDNQVLERLAIETQTADFVSAEGKVTYSVSRNEQSKADILLLAMWGSKNEGEIFTGKFFEYLSCCKPILVTGLISGELPKLISELGVGSCGVNSNQIQNAIRNCCNIIKSGSLQTDTHKEKLEKYTANHQYTRLAEKLENLLA